MYGSPRKLTDPGWIQSENQVLLRRAELGPPSSKGGVKGSPDRATNFTTSWLGEIWGRGLRRGRLRRPGPGLRVLLMPSSSGSFACRWGYADGWRFGKPASEGWAGGGRPSGLWAWDDAFAPKPTVRRIGADRQGSTLCGPSARRMKRAGENSALQRPARAAFNPAYAAMLAEFPASGAFCCVARAWQQAIHRQRREWPGGRGRLEGLAMGSASPRLQRPFR